MCGPPCAATSTTRTRAGRRSWGASSSGSSKSVARNWRATTSSRPARSTSEPKANRFWDHLRLVLDAAEYQGPTWPYARDLITKAGPTGQFLGRSPQVRRKIAEHSLRAALSVPEPERVAGRRILVLDDVYSEGFSMREMARALIEAGAAEVAGIVLARKKGG